MKKISLFSIGVFFLISLFLLSEGKIKAAVTLIGWWKFDEIVAGSTAVDSSGSGFNAAPQNAPNPSTDIPSAITFADPRSINLNGANQYFTLSRPVQDNMSICAWIKTSSGGNGTHHFLLAPILESEVAGVDNDFGFGIDSNKKLAFGNGGSSDITVTSAAVVADGNWNHVCATRNVSNGEVFLYINGTQDGAGITDTVTLNANPNANIGIGTDGGTLFSGNIDDLRVYSSVLTSAEVANLANGFIDPDPTPTPTSSPSTSTPANTTPSSSNSSNAQPAICTNNSPHSAPQLFQLESDRTSVTLYFSPVSPSTGYVVSYGVSPEATQYATWFDSSDTSGVVVYTIQDLSQNTEYYFKVQGKNGCQTGSWSGTLAATTKGTFVGDNSEPSAYKVEPTAMPEKVEQKPAVAEIVRDEGATPQVKKGFPTRSVVAVVGGMGVVVVVLLVGVFRERTNAL